MFSSSLGRSAATGILLSLSVPLLALAGSTPGNIGIVRGAADADGGTVTATIKEKGPNGRTVQVTIRVLPGEASQNVMRRLEEAIRTDPRSGAFTTSIAPFEIGTPPNNQTVDNIHITSNRAWQIDTISIDPDSSGFRDVGANGDVKKSSFNFRDDPAHPGPRFCEWSILRVRDNDIVGSARVPFVSSLGALGALDLFSSTASGLGFQAQRIGNTLDLGELPANESVFMSVTTVDGGDLPFVQEVVCTFVPAPSSAILALAGSLLTVYRRRSA